MVMEFGEVQDEYYRQVFKPAIEAAGLVAVRGDDVFHAGTIIEDIWKATNDAVVILADLTGKNANVLYELGLAHAIGKPAVIVVQALEDVPFDLKSRRIIPYKPVMPDWAPSLASRITRALTETLNQPGRAVLPLLTSDDNGWDSEDESDWSECNELGWPEVTEIRPNPAQVGEVLILTGQDLHVVKKVEFAGGARTSPTWDEESDALAATVLAAALSGRLILIEADGGQSESDQELEVLPS